MALCKFFRFFVLFLLFFHPNFLGIAHNVRYGVKYTKLGNGLDVYVVPYSNQVSAVFHAMIYRVGGMDDPIGKTGLAHYLERLVFEISEKFKNIESIMNNIGARFNAFTTREYTCYYELVSKEDLPLVMEIEADRMKSLNVYQGKIDKEKSIILEERRMMIDNNPNNLLLEEMNSVFYRAGYGRPIIGWEDDIKTYNIDDIIKFYNDYYNPGNSILLVIGDVDFNEIAKLASEKYGKIKFTPPKIRYYPNHDLAYNASLLLTLESSKVKEPVLYFRYRVPLFKNIDEIYAVNLAVEVLGVGKFSRLYKSLILDKNIAASVFAYYNNLTFSDGYVDIEVIPKIGVELSVIERELDGVISNFLLRGVTDNELQNAKSRYKEVQLGKLSDLTSIAMFYIPRLALGMQLDEIDILCSKIDFIDLKEVNNKIRVVFSTTKLVGRLLSKREYGE
ncbi:MAG: insulinase family protein [Wolbachia endosymbiont of Menacanthus eurysternus]|nr:MAG: insulinase family protein [Wolbachia endosymbiont of Menacanthus eurysternus]